MKKKISIGESNSDTEVEPFIIKKVKHNPPCVTNIMSGEEHMKNQQMAIEEQIKSDASFYDKCWKYIQLVQGGTYNYNTLTKAISDYNNIEKDPSKLQEYIKINVVGSNLCNLPEEEVKDNAMELLAILYCFFSQSSDQKQQVLNTVSELFNDSISSELLGDIINSFNENEE